MGQGLRTSGKGNWWFVLLTHDSGLETVGNCYMIPAHNIEAHRELQQWDSHEGVLAPWDIMTAAGMLESRVSDGRGPGLGVGEKARHLSEAGSVCLVSGLLFPAANQL